MMSDEQLKAILKTELEARLGEVLTGVVEKVNIWFSSMAEVLRAVEELGGVENDDRDTNGWEPDIWQSFTFEGKKYTIQTSGWTGGAYIYKDDNN